MKTNKDFQAFFHCTLTLFANSWYDFACAIMEVHNITCKVNPIETTDYPTKAKRPQYSVLNKKKV